MSDIGQNAAVTNDLLETIIELQSLPAFRAFALAGGTGLAVRYNHRRSVDIDLFTNFIVGVAGLKSIEQELKERFGNDLLFCEINDPGAGEQFCFLRAFVVKANSTIKVEAIQNIQILDPVEMHGAIRVLSKSDIALLKLMSASNRMAKKDIYDLDFLTDEIPLDHLIALLAMKQSTYNTKQFQCLFDLDGEKSPANDLALLLAFDDNNYNEIPHRPNHSNDIIDILPHSKTWISARTSWKAKVRALMRASGMTPPTIKPVN